MTSARAMVGFRVQSRHAAKIAQRTSSGRRWSGGTAAFQRREDEKQRRLFRLERGDLRVDCTDSAFVLCGETGEVQIFG